MTSTGLSGWVGEVVALVDTNFGCLFNYWAMASKLFGRELGWRVSLGLQICQGYPLLRSFTINM